ncbi:MAG: STAS/SEC14 domain-containing protein [Bacteroidota bacterium]
MILIPQNVQTTEWPTSVTWFDDNGLLYCVYKKGVERSMKETRDTIEEFKKQLNGKKVCMLADVTNSGPSSKQIREYAATELPKFIKAIAMISDSPLGKMLANLFLTLKSQPYPTRVFNNENEAREWLKQYL